eukprot:scaffold4712_cov68-Cylindrotheca_fusiformis.AAC.1
MVIRKEEDFHEEGFVACLKSEGTNIFIETWTPTDRDLNEHRHIVLTSSNPWNPQAVNFPSSDYYYTVNELEGVNVAAVHLDAADRRDITSFGDPYCEPLKIFDIRAFNARIVKSLKVPVLVSEGPLAEDELKAPRTFVSSQRHTNTTAEDLSEVWGINLEQTRMTLEATTQHHSRSAVLPLSRRYRMDRMFEPVRLTGDMATDTMDPRCPGMHAGFRYCQVFGNREMLAEAYPIKSKRDCEDALKKFLREYGAPEKMISDGSKEQTGHNTKFQSTLRKNRVVSEISPPHRSNYNPCETVIRELRKRWYRAIFRTNCPRALWSYGLPQHEQVRQKYFPLYKKIRLSLLFMRTRLERYAGLADELNTFLRVASTMETP